MDGIRDLLTNICLVGAAVSFVACLLIAGKRQLARAAGRIAKTPRSVIAAFLLFAAIATVCAQKGGKTNEPPRGVPASRSSASGGMAK